MESVMAQKGLVCTVKDLCRVCYTCVRECPVKAIRLVDGLRSTPGPFGFYKDPT